MTVKRIGSSKVLWQKHVDLYAEVFKHSLQGLCQENCIKGNEGEDDITVYLWKNLKNVCKQWSLARNQEIPAPLGQVSVQDVARAAKKGLNALKKPDFTCFRFNAPEGENIGLHIECKKLGTPSCSGWKYNENYVTNGIARFDSKEHQYGTNAVSGMMVGYIVSMSPKDILKEVNEFQRNEFAAAYPNLKFNFRLRSVFSDQQKIVRINIVPKDFQLIHLWADLR